MEVSELIDLLKTFPQNAKIGKISLSDDTGESDSEMTKEDWGLAENVRDSQGNHLDEKYIFCSFGKIDEES